MFLHGYSHQLHTDMLNAISAKLSYNVKIDSNHKNDMVHVLSQNWWPSPLTLWPLMGNLVMRGTETFLPMLGLLYFSSRLRREYGTDGDRHRDQSIRGPLWFLLCGVGLISIRDWMVNENSYAEARADIFRDGSTPRTKDTQPGART